MSSLQLYFKSSGEEIALQSAEWKDDGIVCRSEMTPMFNLGEMDSFMFTHLTGADMFDGYVTDYNSAHGESEMYCEFTIKIHGQITQNATQTQQLKYHPVRLDMETTGQTIYLSGYTLEDNNQTLKCIYPPQDFEAIYLGHLDKITLTHPTGTQTFSGYITEWNGEDSFTVKIQGEILKTMISPDVSPIKLTGGTFGGAELKIEYSSPEDDYKNLWSNMESKPGLILDEVRTFTKENSMFKAGDKVIIVNICEYEPQHNQIDKRWYNDKEVLRIVADRGPGENFRYTCVDQYNYQSHVVGSWLKYAGKQPKKLKYPENAITRAQALKLAKQLHPNVTHIAKSADASWYVYELVSGIGQHSYKSNNYTPIIHIPIRYDGTWKDSIFPKVYFSEPIGFLGFDNQITILEDGSVKVGCNTVPNKVVDQIIRHRIAELKKFPGAKKKPVKKKASKK